MAASKQHFLNDKQLAEVLQQLDKALESDVTSFVRFSWCDFHGIARGVTVPAVNAKYFLQHGYSAFYGKISPRSANA